MSASTPIAVPASTQRLTVSPLVNSPAIAGRPPTLFSARSKTRIAASSIGQQDRHAIEAGGLYGRCLSQRVLRGGHDDEGFAGEVLNVKRVGRGDVFLEHEGGVDLAVCERASQVTVKRTGGVGAKQQPDPRVLVVKVADDLW